QLGIARAIGPILEDQKHRAGIRRIGEARATKSDDAHGVRDAGRVQTDLDHPPLNLVSASQGGAGRQLQYPDEIAAVDLRNEPERRIAEFIEPVAQDGDVEHEHEADDAHRAADQPMIAAGETIEYTVEGGEKSEHRHLTPS